MIVSIKAKKLEIFESKPRGLRPKQQATIKDKKANRTFDVLQKVPLIRMIIDPIVAARPLEEKHLAFLPDVI